MNVAKNDGEMLSRVCTRCESIVDYAQKCQKCYEFFINAPKWEEMTPDERADEILSWEHAEIGFAETYTRIQELLGRELFKHELYEECGGVQTLAYEARSGVQIGMLGIFAKALLLPDGETVPVFVSRDQEKVKKFLEDNPDVSRLSTIALIDELERSSIDFDVIEFRPDHDFLVKASDPNFSIEEFMGKIKAEAEARSK